MRPYLEWHGDLDVVFNYIMRPGSEPLGGTIPNLGNRDLKKRLSDLSSSIPAPKPFLHMTLSLPAGYRATRKVWLRLVKAALRALGMDPNAMPWFAARHSDSTCDHIHCVTALQEFSGRNIVVTGNREKSEDIHRELCRMTGLPQPAYFDPNAGPRLLPITPSRNLTNEDKKQLHADLQHVFLNHQPGNLEELNLHLAKRPGGFQGMAADTGHGTTSILWQNQRSEFFSGELGDAWTPRFMNDRMRFSQALRTLRHDLDLGNLAALFNTPSMEKTLVETIRAVRASATSQRSCNDHEPAPADRSECHNIAPVAGPIVPPSGPERNVGGTAGATAERLDQNAEQLSNRTGYHERHARASDAGNRNIGETVQRAADLVGDKADRNDRLGIQADRGTLGTDGEEARPDADDVATATQLTFASLLARVDIAAANCAAGWRIKAMRGHRGVAIVFADQSAAKVGPAIVNIAIDGAEVRLFEAAYQAQVMMPQLADPDEEIEIESDQDDGPGF